MLLCSVYAMLFVDSVDMKIKACYALNAMFFETVNTGAHYLIYSMCLFICIDSIDIVSTFWLITSIIFN